MDDGFVVRRFQPFRNLSGGAGSWSAPLPGSVSFAVCASAYDKRADIHEAFLSLGCALICWQFLQNGSVTR
jgi:hypothetical protein